MVRWYALALAAACSGGKARDEQGSGGASGSGSAVPVDAAVAVADGAGPKVDAGAPGGDVAVKVEWKDVPAAARASPGRTSCNTPRAASVSPTTTWQIPEAVVFVEGAGTLPAEARVTLGNCAFSPRVAVGAALLLESTGERPLRATIAKWGDARDLGKLAAGAERTIQLPIAGHGVAVALEPGGIYRLATDEADGETAWIVAAPAAVTEASGQVMVRAPAGARALRAFVPARGGQPARVGEGTATVVAGDLVEVAVDIAP